jgi:hypothetical protein
MAESLDRKLTSTEMIDRAYLSFDERMGQPRPESESTRIFSTQLLLATMVETLQASSPLQIPRWFSLLKGISPPLEIITPSIEEGPDASLFD